MGALYGSMVALYWTLLIEIQNAIALNAYFPYDRQGSRLEGIPF